MTPTRRFSAATQEVEAHGMSLVRAHPRRDRLHLDLGAPDLDAEVERLTGAGASVVAQREMGDFRWVTIADPDGNEFGVANH